MQVPLVLDNGQPYDILLKQESLYGKNKYRDAYCCQLESDTFKWSYTAPTPNLQQRGLTPSTLKNVIKVIESKVNQSLHVPYIEALGCISITSLITGILALIYPYIYNQFPTGYFVAGVAGIIFIICIFIIRKKRKRAWDKARSEIRKCVEVDLNEIYQEKNNIRWSIVEDEECWVHYRNGQQTGVSKYPYYHIGIKCIGNAAVVIPAVIVVDKSNNDENIAAAPSGDELQLPLPNGWRSVQTPDGKIFYQNDITNQIQWERPISVTVENEGNDDGIYNVGSGDNVNHASMSFGGADMNEADHDHTIM